MSDLEPDQRLQEVDQEMSQQTAALGVESKGIRIPHQLAAFKHRNYRLFFGGQIISLTGTWLQSVAQGWLVLQLTNSSLLLGVVSAIGSIPILAFSLTAGVVADRFNKRNLLVVTQAVMMILAFILAVLTHWGWVTVYHIIVLGFLLGTANAFDAPARQSFVIEMVGREDLTNAIALNSAMFNGARIAGPAIAGLVIAALGLAGAFFLNGASFIAVIAGLLMMQVNYVPRQSSHSASQELKEGLRFVRHHSMVLALLILAAMVSIFATPYAVLMPKFAADYLHLGAQGYGYLLSAVGVGALTGAITLSFLGDIRWKGKLLLAGNVVFCVMLVLFSYSRYLPISLALLYFVGWGMMTNMALTNTLIQISVPDQLRGRVVSVYTLMFMGMTPVGSLVAGVVAHVWNIPVAIRLGAVVCMASALLLSPRFVDGGRDR